MRASWLCVARMSPATCNLLLVLVLFQEVDWESVKHLQDPACIQGTSLKGLSAEELEPLIQVRDLLLAY